MVSKQHYQAYAMATQTVAKTRQIIMLYDGVVRLVQQAKEAIQGGRIEERYHLLIKASEILYGMQACLDFEQGGDVARVLYSYYANIDSKIFTLHRTNSIQECDAIIADLKQMRDAWQEIDTSMHGDDKPSAESTIALPPNHPVEPLPQAPQNLTLSA